MSDRLLGWPSCCGRAGYAAISTRRSATYGAKYACLVSRFCCCTCGAQFDDDRWSLSRQCARCEGLERRKHTDELFRKVMAEIADEGLTITWPSHALPAAISSRPRANCRPCPRSFRSHRRRCWRPLRRCRRTRTGTSSKPSGTAFFTELVKIISRRCFARET